MTRIRKFVVGATAAAGIAVFGIALATQTALASTASIEPGLQASTVATQATPSGACTSAIQALKAAVAADATEDAAERAVAMAEGAEAADQAEDATEFANFKSLFSAIRSGCAPSAARPVVTQAASTAQCTAAVQALKAAWAQGRPTTRAQWQHLQSLAQAARTACGWSWSRR